MLARKVQIVSLSMAVSASIAAFSGAALAVDPAHVTWAENVALNVLPAYNDYNYNPSYVHWTGTSGATRYENRSVCNSFVTIVLKQAYGWDDTYFRNWMGATSPLASTFHDEIELQDGFTRINSIGSVAVGDLIAIEYPAGSSVSGHMMIVTSLPTARTATRPIVTNTYQYEVEVLDSSSSAHGTTDTRVMADGTTDAGVGIGIFRIYTDSNGAFVGYTWSTSSGSTYYTQSQRHLVVGRVIPPSIVQRAGTTINGKKIGMENKLGGYDYTLEPEE